MTESLPWLERTLEAAIEPELHLCDPHHHLWVYPTSRYLLDELLGDLGSGHRVLSTVYVECQQFYRTDGPIELRPVGETEFVEGVAAAHARATGRRSIAAGIVGFADLRLGAAVLPVLEAHMAASDRFRGVRYATAWDPSPEIRRAHTDPPPGLLGDGAFRAGLACLGRLGLSFDAWLYHPQFGELADLARALPDLTIVLNHLGGPLGIGPYAGRREAVFEDWRSSLAQLAQCPNVHAKLGGRTHTMSGFGWHRRERPPGSAELASAMAPYYQAAIELFGPARCMFESDFPVERTSCSYAVLWNAFKLVTRAYSAGERCALLHDTAVRVYRLAA
jgi:predicted TIM-barrel fold metal-dependent hydrolase